MPGRLQVTHDLDRLGATLAEISRVTGKDVKRLVADSAVQFLIGGNGITGMAERTKALKPDKGRISEVAKLRGYRVGIFHSRARERALRDFGGIGRRESILARRRKSTFAPTTKRGGGFRRLTYRGGKLVNARGAEDSVSTSAARFAGLKTKGGVSLNLRALTVYYELRAREASRASLAASCSFSGIRSLRARDAGALALSTRSASGRTTGTVSFVTAKDDAVATISNFVPIKSVRLEPLASATLAQVAADKTAYLNRKILDNFNRIRK